MISAGLAGSTPHMISATINALGRVVFEFRNDMATPTLQELSQTVELFLTSNNREIVKSALGFVKIAAVSLPEEIVEPSLKGLVENLLVWSHEHKGHFKAKVKHIIERLVRRFGYDKIAAVFPEQDARLLSNIRKSKERAKRKKLAGDGDGVSSSTRGSSKYANEFDAALYGSSDESDGEASENDDEPRPGRRGKNEKYILEQGDTPIDLMDRKSLAHISSTKPRAKSNEPLKLKDKHKFAKDSSGRIVVKERDEDNDEIDLKSGIDAYVEAIKAGPVKGQRNKLKYRRGKKFNQDPEGDDSEDEGSRRQNNDVTRKTSRPLHNKITKKKHNKNPRKKF
jgi:ribosomal RNA-processing protein 12